MKESAILATAFFLTFLLRKRAAAERHIVWAVAIVSAALLPILTFILPVWQPAFAERVVSSIPRLSATATKSRDAGGPAITFQAQRLETSASAFDKAWS